MTIRGLLQTLLEASLRALRDMPVLYHLYSWVCHHDEPPGGYVGALVGAGRGHAHIVQPPPGQHHRTQPVHSALQPDTSSGPQF